MKGNLSILEQVFISLGYDDQSPSCSLIVIICNHTCLHCILINYTNINCRIAVYMVFYGMSLSVANFSKGVYLTFFMIR